MSESKVVEKTKTPATIESLQTDLRALGIRPGIVVLVHSSLSAMGWVCGGSVAVVTALQKVLGSTGTLVMPAHSSGLERAEQVGKSSCARVVVACNTRESTICTVLSFFSVWVMETIRPCTLRNIGRIFLPSALCRRVLRSLRWVRGDGLPLKILTSIVRILIA